MDLLSAVVLGVIQGVTEWLPVSSSAQNLFFLVGVLKFDPQVAFSLSVFLHLGTLLAAVLRFRQELLKAVADTLTGKKSKLMHFIIIATFFSALTGIPFYLFLKNVILEGQGALLIASTGVFLVLTALILHSVRLKFGTKHLNDASSLDAGFTGLMQGIAVLPGVSRSGITVASLLLRKFNHEDALKITFIISIPVVLGLVGIEVLEGGFSSLDFNAALIGMATSFVVGYFTIDLLLAFARKTRFDLFCFVFGLFAILVSAVVLFLR